MAKNLQVTTQKDVSIKFRATIDTFQMNSFEVFRDTATIIIGWSRGFVLDSTFRETSSHKTIITNSSIVTTDGVDYDSGQTNPFNTLISRLNTGNYTPETTFVDFIEYVLQTYANV